MEKNTGSSDWQDALDSLAEVNQRWIGENRTGRLPALTQATMGIDEIDALYRHNDYAGKIVDKVPEECTRRGWDVVVSEGEDDQDGNPDINPFDEDMKRLKVPQMFTRADKIARKDGGALLYICMADGQEQLSPVDEKKITDVKHLILLERWQANPEEWDNDLESPTFAEPLAYRITPMVPNTGTETRVVHATRVLRFDGVWLPPRLSALNCYWGDSVLQRCHDKIKNFTNLENDIAYIVRSFSFVFAKIDGLAGLVSGGNKEAVITRLRLLNQALTTMKLGVLDAEKEEIQSAQRSVAGLSELYDRMAQSLASSGGMPVTLLFGQAPGGLATDDESGRTYWYDGIGDRQKNYYQPLIEKLVRYIALSKNGPTKGVVPKDWKIQFKSLKEPTETELADLRQKQATTDGIYLQWDVVSKEEVRESRFGRSDWSSETVLQERVEPVAQAATPEEEAELGGGGEGGGPVAPPVNPSPAPAAGASEKADAKSKNRVSRFGWTGAAGASFKYEIVEKTKRDAEGPAADYFRNISGNNMPFVGDPGSGKPVGGPAVLQAMMSGRSKKIASETADAIVTRLHKSKMENPPAVYKHEVNSKPSAVVGDLIAKIDPPPVSQMPREVQQSVRSYTGSESEEINNYLRGTGNDDLPEFKELSPQMLEKRVKDIDSAMRPLKSPVLAYRGVDGDFGDELLKLDEGCSFEDSAFVSTSIGSGIPNQFAGTSGVLLEIYVPVGARAQYVAPISDYVHEQELILGRKSQFRVMGKHVSANSPTVLIVSLESQGSDKFDDLTAREIDNLDNLREFPPSMRKAAFDRVGGRCENYGVMLKSAGSDNAGQWHAHHKSRDAGHVESNLQVLCNACHKKTPTWGKSKSSADAEEPAFWRTVSGTQIPFNEAGEPMGGPAGAVGSIAGKSSKSPGPLRASAAPDAIAAAISKTPARSFDSNPKDPGLVKGRNPKYLDEVAALTSPPPDSALPKSAQKALETYSGETYTNINGHLRGTKELSSAEARKVESITKEIDKSLVPLKEPITLYRGVGGELGERILNAAPGTKITDNAFVSTSVTSEVGRGFSQRVGTGRKSTQILIEIHAPAGLKGRYMPGLSGLASEQEMLLERGSQMVILGSEKGKGPNKGYTVVKAYMAPPSGNLDAADDAAETDDLGMPGKSAAEMSDDERQAKFGWSESAGLVIETPDAKA